MRLAEKREERPLADHAELEHTGPEVASSHDLARERLVHLRDRGGLPGDDERAQRGHGWFVTADWMTSKSTSCAMLK